MYTTIHNAIYLRRRGKISLPEPDGEPASERHLASLLKNLEALGYGFDAPLLDAARALSVEQLAALHDAIVPEITRLRGAHRKHRAFYPNFPQQVMELSQAQLYLNAILHYLSGGRLRPADAPERRQPRTDLTKLTWLGVGDPAEFTAIFRQMLASSVALAPQDRDDLTWYLSACGGDVELPERVPNKENLAFLAGYLPAEAIAPHCTSATDILRIAVSLSGGDISLAKPSRLRTFSRRERVLLLTLLEARPHRLEEMQRRASRWIRLGEKLHPGEWRKRFPATAADFDALRNGRKAATVAAAVERALATGDVAKALACLRSRPGEMARRLDHLLRLDPSAVEDTLAAFAEAAAQVSTNVLLQVRRHFLDRAAPGDLRVFLPKGNVARAVGVPNALPALPQDLCRRVADACAAALEARFAALPPLGNVWIDPQLADFPVPFALRSASRSLRTVTRGSRLPLPDADTVRCFLWWRNGTGRTDIDLSAALFDDAFTLVDTVSYYNLKTRGALHSGDIVDAPNGASEFVDLPCAALRDSGVRFVALVLNSYTQQSYVELPECFAGWMARTAPGSGEIFDPATVQDRLDLSADTKIALPLLIDLEEDALLWCDLALRRNPNWVNNVAGNQKGITLALQAMRALRKPDLYDLLTLHARARGTLAASEETADRVFSVAAGTPFQPETIAAEFLAG